MRMSDGSSDVCSSDLLRQALCRPPGQSHGRLAARQVYDAQCPPVYPLPRNPGPQGLGASLLGGKPLGIAGRPRRTTVRLLALNLREHPGGEAIAEALQGLLDAPDVDQVATQAEDHRLCSATAPSSQALRAPPAWARALFLTARIRAEERRAGKE